MSKESILVVDDEREILELVKYNLAKEGYDVIAAMNGEAGLDLAIQQGVDAIVLDLMLPGMDGLEVCRRLRAESRTQYVPLIMLTAKAEELDRVLDPLGESGADAIGVNSRNLKTFDVSLETAMALVERIPVSVVRVAESGISTAEDMSRLRKAGFDAFLIGESLMRQADPGAALAALLAGTGATP